MAITIVMGYYLLLFGCLDRQGPPDGNLRLRALIFHRPQVSPTAIAQFLAPALLIPLALEPQITARSEVLPIFHLRNEMELGPYCVIASHL